MSLPSWKKVLTPPAMYYVAHLQISRHCFSIMPEKRDRMLVILLGSQQGCIGVVQKSSRCAQASQRNIRLIRVTCRCHTTWKHCFERCRCYYRNKQGTKHVLSIRMLTMSLRRACLGYFALTTSHSHWLRACFMLQALIHQNQGYWVQLSFTIQYQSVTYYHYVARSYCVYILLWKCGPGQRMGASTVTIGLSKLWSSRTYVWMIYCCFDNV
jgi:hypothetical protein